MRSKFKKYSLNIFLVAIFVSPLIFFTDVTRNPYLIQERIYQVLVAIALVLIFLQAKDDKKIFFPSTFLDKPLLLFFGAALLSVIFSLVRYPEYFRTISSYGGRRMLMFLFCSIFTFYLTAAFSVKRDAFRKIIYALTGAATVSAAYAVMQFAGLDFIWPRSVDPYGQRSISTFGNPNFLSSYLLISIFCIIGHIYTSNKKIKNTHSVWYIMLLINIAGLAITMTRSSYLGLAAGVAIVVYYLIKNTGKSVKKPLVIFLVLIISVGGLFSLSSRQFRERAVSFFSVEKMGDALTQRLLIWEASWNMFKDTPVIGRGWGNFEIFYPVYQGRIVEKEAYRNLRTHANNAHNILLELLTQVGILGTGLYIFLIAVFVKFSFSLFSKAEEKNKIWVVVFFAGAVAFWTDNLLNVSLFFPMPAIAFWVNMGLLAGLGRKVMGAKEIKFNIGKFYTPALVLIGVFTAGVIYFNALYFFSSIHFFKGFKASRQGRLIVAERELKKAHSLYSLNVDNNYELGNVYARLAGSGPGDSLDKAIWAYGEALQANPGYDEIYFNLGIMHLRAGNTKKSLKKLKEAVNINPLSAGAYRTLGDITVRQDNLTLAASYYIRTLRIDPGNEAAVNNLRYLASRQQKTEIADKLNELFSEASNYIKDEKWQEALKITEEILTIDPANMQAFLYAGNIHYQMDNYWKAEEYYRIILAVNPNHETAQSNLAAIKNN